MCFNNNVIRELEDNGHNPSLGPGNQNQNVGKHVQTTPDNPSNLASFSTYFIIYIILQVYARLF